MALRLPDFLSSFRPIWLGMAVFAGLMRIAAAQVAVADDSAARKETEARSQGPEVDIETEMRSRRSAAENFRRRLDETGTPEEKRALIDQWREQNKARYQARIQEVQDRPVSDEESRVRHDPEMAQRLAEVEKIKRRLEAIRQAEGEERQRLLRELQEERREQVKERVAKLAAARPSETGNSDAGRANLPDEVRQWMAGHEERRKVADEMRVALKNGDEAGREKALQKLKALREKSLQRKQEETGGIPAVP